MHLIASHSALLAEQSSSVPMSSYLLDAETGANQLAPVRGCRIASLARPKSGDVDHARVYAIVLKCQRADSLPCVWPPWRPLPVGPLALPPSRCSSRTRGIAKALAVCHIKVNAKMMPARCFHAHGRAQLPRWASCGTDGCSLMHSCPSSTKPCVSERREGACPAHTKVVSSAFACSPVGAATSQQMLRALHVCTEERSPFSNLECRELLPLREPIHEQAWSLTSHGAAGHTTRPRNHVFF